MASRRSPSSAKRSSRGSDPRGAAAPAPPRSTRHPLPQHPQHQHHEVRRTRSRARSHARHLGHLPRHQRADFPHPRERAGTWSDEPLHLLWHTPSRAPRAPPSSTGVEPMSTTQDAPVARRVRHQAREAVAVHGVLRGHLGRDRAPACSCSRAWRGRRLSMSGPSHVPVLLDRVVALLAPGARARAAPCSSTPPSASVATPRPCSTRCPQAARDRRRPRPRGPGARRRAARAVRRPVHRRRTPSTTRSPRGARRARPRRGSTASSSTSGSPRMQLDVRRARLRLRRRTRRSTCAWTRPAAAPPADVLNTYSAGRADPDPRDYGEEKFARKIAAADRARARARRRSPPRRRLVELCHAEIPAPARRTGGHPAKRTFQALRIEVNDELAVLAARAARRARRARASADAWSC